MADTPAPHSGPQHTTPHPTRSTDGEETRFLPRRRVSVLDPPPRWARGAAVLRRPRPLASGQVRATRREPGTPRRPRVRTAGPVLSDNPVVWSRKQDNRSQWSWQIDQNLSTNSGPLRISRGRSLRSDRDRIGDRYPTAELRRETPPGLEESGT